MCTTLYPRYGTSWNSWNLSRQGSRGLTFRDVFSEVLIAWVSMHLRTDPTTLKIREQQNAVSGTDADASTHVGRTSMEDIFLDPGIGT